MTKDEELAIKKAKKLEQARKDCAEIIQDWNKQECEICRELIVKDDLKDILADDELVLKNHIPYIATPMCYPDYKMCQAQAEKCTKKTT